MKEILDKHKFINKDSNSLFEAILQLKNIDEAHRFFRDLLTQKEIVELSQRWKVVKMLDRKVLYSKIEEETGMSSTTIARIQKWLKKGTGGYQLILKRTKGKD